MCLIPNFNDFVKTVKHVENELSLSGLSNILTGLYERVSKDSFRLGSLRSKNWLVPLIVSSLINTASVS